MTRVGDALDVLDVELRRLEQMRDRVAELRAQLHLVKRVIPVSQRQTSDLSHTFGPAVRSKTQASLSK